MTRVAIRVDASAEIGTGHLQRCLSLALALRACGAQVVLLCRPLDAVAPRRLADAGFPVQWLSAPDAARSAPAFAPSVTAAQDAELPRHAAWAQVSWQQDAQETIAFLQGERPDWVLLDHYAFDARWLAAARAAVGCRCAVIDDLADRALDGDLLIDPNWHPDHRAKFAACMPPAATVLGGPRHALLAPAYAQAAPLVVREEVRSIGVFMGGTDPGQHSAAVLQVCREPLGFAGDIEVVSTSANPHLTELRAACARWQARLTLDLPDLVDFFARHDLQVGAGGGATWERCCLGVPSILLLTAANQQAVLPALVQRGVAQLGTLPDGPAGAQTLAQELRALMDKPAQRHAMAEAARQLVDGRGAQRVALHMLRATLTVRQAVTEDGPLLHRWRNDPATRAVSGSGQEIALAPHLRWLSAVLADPARVLLVGQVGAVPVGSIRFDRCAMDRCNQEASGGAGEVEVSLYLDPALHGLGLGAYLLAAGHNWVRTHWPDAALVRAQVLPGNAASQRLFVAAGYAGGPTLYTRALRATEDCL